MKPWMAKYLLAQKAGRNRSGFCAAGRVLAELAELAAESDPAKTAEILTGLTREAWGPATALMWCPARIPNAR